VEIEAAVLTRYEACPIVWPTSSPSVGSPGDSYDNALGETINALYASTSSAATWDCPAPRPRRRIPASGDRGGDGTRWHRARPGGLAAGSQQCRLAPAAGLAALSHTLICGEDSVYDPAHFNDRLFLGLKGTTSEAELHVLKSRLQGGILNKARRRELEMPLPVALVYRPDGRVCLDLIGGSRTSCDCCSTRSARPARPVQCCAPRAHSTRRPFNNGSHFKIAV
jgi:hypothetical protein